MNPLPSSITLLRIILFIEFYKNIKSEFDRKIFYVLHKFQYLRNI